MPVTRFKPLVRFARREIIETAYLIVDVIERLLERGGVMHQADWHRSVHLASALSSIDDHIGRPLTHPATHDPS